MIEINNLTSQKINAGFFKKTAEAVLKEEKAKGDLSLAFFCKRRMEALNKKYRKKEKPTDVLSFNYDSKLLGEVVICPEVVKANAKEFNLEYNEELGRVLIHGILHILGYSHGEKMERKQEFYLKKLKF